MDLSRPERGPDRAGRKARRRRRQRRWRVAKASLELTILTAAAATLVRIGPYLRRSVVHLPAIPHPLQMTVFVVAGVFLAGQVVLLILAIVTVNKPSHDRYLDLMLYWPFVLVAPYVIVKRRALPDRYFSRSAQYRSRRAEKSDSSGEPSPTTPVAPEHAKVTSRLAVTQTSDTDPPVTPEQYRDALRLVMQQLSSVTTDLDLQELLMRQLRSLEQQTQPEDQQ